jgi:hypothetical protein
MTATREALAFQRSLVQSGETWTATCAVVESEALAEIGRYEQITADAAEALHALDRLAARLEEAEALVREAEDATSGFTGVVADLHDAEERARNAEEALREIANDYHCVVVEPDPDAGQHLDGCVGCFARVALGEQP